MDPELCKELLEAAAAGDSARTARAIGALYPNLKEYVGRLYRGNLARLAAKKGRNDDDLLGHVEERILRKPPNGSGANAGLPSVTVMAWVKTTAKNYLLDQRDADEGDAHPSDAEVSLDKSLPDPGAGPEASAAAARLTRGLRRMLERCYPKGLPVFEILLEAGVSDAELALQLETSVNNVQAIRRRTRLYCGVYRALLEDPRVPDVELARMHGMKPGPDGQPIKELRDIAGKVRQLLATTKKGGQ